MIDDGTRATAGLGLSVDDERVVVTFYRVWWV